MTSTYTATPTERQTESDPSPQVTPAVNANQEDARQNTTDKTNETNGTNGNTDQYPMPEGYMQRLQTKTFTKNDLAWQAIATLQDPSIQETKLVASAASHEAMAKAARKRAERLQAERGVATISTAGLSWDQRLTPIGDLVILPTQDLLLGTLHPTAHTILFGQGDAGKGTAAAWLAKGLATTLAKRILIVDFEHNEGEWQPRLQSLGYEPNGQIQYYNPDEVPIWDQAAAIASAAAGIHADYLIIDSLTFACMTDTSGGDTSHAMRYKAALTRIGLPALSLAHIPKVTTEPRYPFGSIFWHNAARTTWRIDHLETAKVTGTFPSRTVTLTNCKRNDGPTPPKQTLEIFYQPGPTGLPVNIEASVYHESQAKRSPTSSEPTAQP